MQAQAVLNAKLTAISKMELKELYHLPQYITVIPLLQDVWSAHTVCVQKNKSVLRVSTPHS